MLTRQHGYMNETKQISELLDLAISLKAAVGSLAANPPPAIQPPGPVLTGTVTHLEWLRMTAANRLEFAANGGCLKRSEISLYLPRQLAAHFKAGGGIADEPAAPTVATPAEAPAQLSMRDMRDNPQCRPTQFLKNGAVKTRLEFSALDDAGKMEFCRTGGRITN
jgi:hypothetical protein